MRLRLSEYSDKLKYRPAGRLISVDANKMHVYAKGNGKYTVVFAAGFGEPCPYVSFYPLHNEISKKTRIVVYDKPGYGWSETTSKKRDIDVIVKEIHDVLYLSGEKSPFIFVGHSLGSIEIIRFAQLYKEEVAAIVLIDGSNPEMYNMIKPVSKLAKLRVNIFHKLIKLINSGGISRLLFNTTNLYSQKIFSDKNRLSLIPDELIKLDESMFLKTINNKNQVEEGEMKEINCSKVLANRSTFNIPFIIYTSEEMLKYKNMKIIQAELLKWSSNSHQVTVQDTKHYIHWYKPRVIIDEIEKLILK